MGVYIKGMEMPKSCSRCFCMASCRLWKNIMHPEFNRHRNCPLVSVPPHGRLIDTDAVILEGGPYEYDEWCKWALERYQEAPTIIPADG